MTTAIKKYAMSLFRWQISKINNIQNLVQACLVLYEKANSAGYSITQPAEFTFAHCTILLPVDKKENNIQGPANKAKCVLLYVLSSAVVM